MRQRGKGTDAEDRPRDGLEMPEGLVGGANPPLNALVLPARSDAMTGRSRQRPER